jgi:small-conductance mechanosensitive channel
MNDLLHRLGSALPTYAGWVSAGAALVIALLAWVVGILAGRLFGPYLANLWQRHAGEESEQMVRRVCLIIRYALTAILIAIVLRADPWPSFSAFILGIGMASASAMLVFTIIRGLDMPRWAAIVLAAAAFFALLVDALDGLRAVARLLDGIGFSAGKAHVSLLGVIQFTIVVLALHATVKLITRIINHSIRRSRSLDATQQLLGQKIGGIILLVLAFFVGVDLMGIDLTALTVFSGAFGLAIGFGLQKTFGNLIAGIILLMDRSIKPGDVIVVGDSVGYVSKIGVRAVSVLTRDGKEHLIPNENLMTQEVENWSYSNPNVRIHIPVAVAYDSDLALAQKLMIEAASHPQRVLKAPAPNVWLLAFGDNGLEHEIMVWIKDPEAGIGNVQSEILNRLWILFRKNGIGVPLPQRDVRIKEWKVEGDDALQPPSR